MAWGPTSQNVPPQASASAGANRRTPHRLASEAKDKAKRFIDSALSNTRASIEALFSRGF